MGTLRWLLPLALGSCVIQPLDLGKSDPDPPPPETARQFFDREVAPILATNCMACHDAGSTVLSLTYDSIVGDPYLNGGFVPARAAIVQKAQHEGPALGSTDTAVIVQWLNLEAAERDL